VVAARHRRYESEYGPVCERCHSRSYRINHPEIYQTWKANNKDYLREYQRKYRQAHQGHAKRLLEIKRSKAMEYEGVNIIQL
jgi:hypothetical protein